MSRMVVPRECGAVTHPFGQSSRVGVSGRARDGARGGAGARRVRDSSAHSLQLRVGGAHLDLGTDSASDISGVTSANPPRDESADSQDSQADQESGIPGILMRSGGSGVCSCRQGRRRACNNLERNL